MKERATKNRIQGVARLRVTFEIPEDLWGPDSESAGWTQARLAEAIGKRDAMEKFIRDKPPGWTVIGTPQVRVAEEGSSLGKDAKQRRTRKLITYKDECELEGLHEHLALADNGTYFTADGEGHDSCRDGIQHLIEVAIASQSRASPCPRCEKTQELCTCK